VASIYKRKGADVWSIAYSPAPRRRKTITGCRSYQATKALADKLEAEAFTRRKGIIDAKADGYAKAQAVALTVRNAKGEIVGGHVADLHAALIAKGATAKHAALVRTRAAKVVELAKAEAISGLTPSAVQAALGELRKSGLSLQTCNHHLRAIKQLSRWLHADGRARDDALAHLGGFNVATDRRHDRRALSDDELARLIATAERGAAWTWRVGCTRRRIGGRALALSGPDRAMLYRLAVATGFRAGEIASLTPASFDLDADPPTITVEAAYSKRRRQDVQPVAGELADLLGPWLEGRPDGAPVFAMPGKPAAMMQADLQAARGAWLAEAVSDEDRERRERLSVLAYRDGAWRVADFHALRHTFVSRVVQSGASVKVAQELARHSTPTLTIGRYAHVTIADTAKALEALPVFGPSDPKAEAMKATGTDNATAQAAQPAPDAPGSRRTGDRATGRPMDRPHKGAARCVANRGPARAGAQRAAPGAARRCAEGRFPDNVRDDATEETEQGDAPQARVNATACAHLRTPETITPGRTRTWNLRFRRPLLCPVELRA